MPLFIAVINGSLRKRRVKLFVAVPLSVRSRYKKVIDPATTFY